MLGHARIGYDEAYIKEQIFASKNILYRYIDKLSMLLRLSADILSKSSKI